MIDQKRRASTIKHCVPNLRAQFRDALAPYTDNQVAAVYEEFSLSDEFGENDKNFPLWFEFLGQVE